MSQDELVVMDGSKCILQVRGVRPFFSDKFDITDHKQYKYLADADPDNAFDIKKYVMTSFRDGTKLKLDTGDKLDVIDVGTVGEMSEEANDNQTNEGQKTIEYGDDTKKKEQWVS